MEETGGGGGPSCFGRMGNGWVELTLCSLQSGRAGTPEETGDQLCCGEQRGRVRAASQLTSPANEVCGPLSDWKAMTIGHPEARRSFLLQLLPWSGAGSCQPTRARALSRKRKVRSVDHPGSGVFGSARISALCKRHKRAEFPFQHPASIRDCIWTDAMIVATAAERGPMLRSPVAPGADAGSCPLPRAPMRTRGEMRAEGRHRPGACQTDDGAGSASACLTCGSSFILEAGSLRFTRCWPMLRAPVIKPCSFGRLF
jgi:hypothetical protein